MIAFSTESESAITSMAEISQSSQLALEPKITLAKSEKIVRGSAKAGVAELGGAEHDHEGDRDHRVDEEAVQPLEVHRDLRIPVRVAALADVAGGGLHRDHVPGQQEGERDVDDEPVVMEGVREEAGSVEVLEAGEVAPVRDRRLEQRQDREQRERDHRDEAEHGREGGAEADAEPGRDEDEQDARRSR